MSLTEFTIRPACEEDSEAILALTINGIREWADPVLEKVSLWMEEVCHLDYVQKRNEDNDYHVFIAEQHNAVVGTIYLNTANLEHAYFGGWYCSVKSQGIGSGLLSHLLAYAKSQGCKFIDCDVYEGNEASVKLMEKHGARKTGSLLYDEVNYLIYTFAL